MTTLSTFTDFCVGNQITIDRLLGDLLAPIASATFSIAGVPGSEIAITGTPTAFGQILDPGTRQDDQTYVAQVVFLLKGGLNEYTHRFFTPLVTTRGSIDIMCADGTGPFTSSLIDFTPDKGGRWDGGVAHPPSDLLFADPS